MEDHPNYQTGQKPDAESRLKHWPTTDKLVAMARTHREGRAYPTSKERRRNLPRMQRAISNFVLSGEADALHTAYAIASLIEVTEQVKAELAKSDPNQH